MSDIKLKGLKEIAIYFKGLGFSLDNSILRSNLFLKITKFINFALNFINFYKILLILRLTYKISLYKIPFSNINL